MSDRAFCPTCGRLLLVKRTFSNVRWATQEPADEPPTLQWDQAFNTEQRVILLCPNCPKVHYGARLDESGQRLRPTPETLSLFHEQPPVKSYKVPLPPDLAKNMPAVVDQVGDAYLVDDDAERHHPPYTPWE